MHILKQEMKKQPCASSWPDSFTPHVVVHEPQHIPNTIPRAPLKIVSLGWGGGRGAPWNMRNSKIAMKSNLPFWRVLLGQDLQGLGPQVTLQIILLEGAPSSVV